MSRDDRISFRISSDKKILFGKLATKLGARPSDILNNLVDRFLESDGEVSIEEVVERLEKLEEVIEGKLAA